MLKLNWIGLGILAFVLVACNNTPHQATTPLAQPTTNVTIIHLPTPTTSSRSSSSSSTAAPAATATPVARATTQLSTAQTIEAKAGATYKDVTYCTPDGVAQKMDVLYPRTIGEKPLPVAVYIHGGGWTSGDKASGAGLLDTREILARGYVVVSLNYRLAPEYKWPAQITDVKCAIRHLRANAGMYKIDPNKIGVWGGSAGGHLVTMLGTTDKSAGFDVGEYLDQSSRVQVVVDEFGPADLPKMFTANAQVVAGRIFGSTSRDDPILVKASPVTYITSDDPPFLILQGDQDQVVPMEQSQILHERLKAGGVQSTLVIVKNAGHGFTPDGGAISPSRTELSKMIADFFDQYLR